jgi:hypothetical protein
MISLVLSTREIDMDNSLPQLVSTLEATYPRLRAWLGDERFERAAIRHLEHNPSYAWTHDACADDFGLTLHELFPDSPGLQELAWIERAVDNAYVSQDSWPVMPCGLASINWDTVHLRLAPSLVVAQATTNAADIWSALHRGGRQPRGRMLAEPKGMLVWQRGYVSCLRSVDAEEMEAISCVQELGSFTALCTMMAQRLGENEGVQRAIAMLARWIGDELVATLHHPQQLN